MPTRSTQFNSISFQQRDFDLLRLLFESRTLTLSQAATLCFEGRQEAAKKRIQKLKTAGLIGERPRRTFESSVLFLGRKAFGLLNEKGILADYPAFSLSALAKRAQVSPLTLRHELEVADVKVAFHSAIKKSEVFTIAEFSTWPLLHEFRACRNGRDGGEVVVRPDGFIRIRERHADAGLSEHTFFLEVDRSTETQNILVTRAGCYLNYYQSGDFAVKNGAPQSAYKDYPFRVLMVFKTAERRNNTAAELLQHSPPILTHTWLTTFQEVTDEPLGEIWIRPID